MSAVPRSSLLQATPGSWLLAVFRPLPEQSASNSVALDTLEICIDLGALVPCPYFAERR